MAKQKPLIITLLLVALFSCAKQEAPSGGPKDKEPPAIVETYPLGGTTEFKDDKIEVEFSEYIEKSSVRNSVFISPNVERLKFDWSGKTLTIYFLDSLRSNTTYTVTFGTDIKDLNEKNNMAEAFSLVFSTGNKIDKGEISGFVFDGNPEGVMIFAYKLKSENAPDPSERKPDYITQCGNDGFYALSGLGAAAYDLFAVRDLNSNELWDDGEQIGFSSDKIKLESDSAKLGGVNFMLTVIDTLAPELEEVTMTDENHFLLEFSESLDSSKLFPENFTIIDSTQNVIYPVKYAYKGKVKRNKMLLAFSDKLSKNDRLFLNAGKVYDKHGNESKRATKEIYYNEKPDTLAPEIIGVTPVCGGEKINFKNPEIRLLFDEGVNPDKKAFEFTGENNTVFPLRLERVNDAEFILFPEEKLVSNSNYILKIDFSSLSDAAGNSRDSVYAFKLATIDEIDLVSVEGKIKLPEKITNKVYVCLDNLTTRLKLKETVARDGRYKFSSVPPGEYFVWAFDDCNGNGKYDFGSVKPQRFSERFAFRNDTLKVRPRWPVKNVNLDF